MCIKTIQRSNRQDLIMNGNLSFFVRNSFFIRVYCILRCIIVIAVATFSVRYKYSLKLIMCNQQQRDKNWNLNSEARQEKKHKNNNKWHYCNAVMVLWLVHHARAHRTRALWWISELMFLWQLFRTEHIVISRQANKYTATEAERRFLLCKQILLCDSRSFSVT